MQDIAGLIDRASVATRRNDAIADDAHFVILLRPSHHFLLAHIPNRGYPASLPFKMGADGKAIAGDQQAMHDPAGDDIACRHVMSTALAALAHHPSSATARMWAAMAWA